MLKKHPHLRISLLIGGGLALCIVLPHVVLVTFVEVSEVSRVAQRSHRPSMCTVMHFLSTTYLEREFGGVDFRNPCLYDFAVSKDNPDVCSAITKQGLKNKCYQHFAYTREDYQYCLFIPGGLALGECFHALLQMGAVDISACDRIGVPGKFGAPARSLCKFGTYEELSDPTQCDQMESSWFKDNCYQKFGLL